MRDQANRQLMQTLYYTITNELVLTIKNENGRPTVYLDV